MSSSPDSGSIATSRAHYPKVRTGCVVCKIRRVKCDETKPQCLKCTSTGRKCEGYLNPEPVKRRERRSKYAVSNDFPTTAAQKDAPGSRDLKKRDPDLWIDPDLQSQILGDINERRSFQFFQARTVQDISGCFESDFWDYLVLQVCHEEATVRHALLALSALYEASEIKRLDQINNNQAETLRRFALQQYTQAVRLLAVDMSTEKPSVHVILMSCLIFVWLEFLQDNLDVALNHLKSGLQILQDVQRSPHPLKIDQALVRLFRRLSITATMHGSPNSDFASSESQMRSIEPVPRQFSNIFDARQSLDDEIDRIIRFHRQMENQDFIQSQSMCHLFPDPLSLDAICQTFLSNLQRWETAFQNLIVTFPRNQDPMASAGICLLQLQHLFLSNTLKLLFVTSQTMYEEFNPEFKRMLYLAEALIHGSQNRERSILSFDTGVIAPLFYVMLKCRDVELRRKALALLKQCPDREGIWHRASAIEFAELKFEMEEQGRGDLPETAPLPESARMYAENARAVVIDGKLVTVLQFRRRHQELGRADEEEKVITNLSTRMAGMLGTGQYHDTVR